ncbi:hypothetical protein ACEZ3G_15865 [Maribacter algicola]|uniref:Uncharacterized protein n=1 Tax=Meishania litoralis TaxID=3434685 RepID=A0ACC7LME7_9FLAO
MKTRSFKISLEIINFVWSNGIKYRLFETFFGQLGIQVLMDLTPNQVIAYMEASHNLMKKIIG